MNLSTASGRTVTVDYATSNGTASSSDYTSASGTLSIAPGATSGTFSVPITNDSLDEDENRLARSHIESCTACRNEVQALIAIEWRGLKSKQDFQEMQASDPILLSMGREDQRALVTG